ncbi:MAG: ABC transporter permease [Candidatus Omnitrophica bacterium]|nr:ABC transporter permease [Candidatus Omnitrophota bacterium]
MKKKVYIPEGPVQANWFSLWKEMTKELIGAKELITRLFIRDFLAKYKQSVFGIIWVIILPITVIGVFIFMIFATGINGCTNSIVNAGSMITKINFPREALVIASVATSVFDFLIRLIMVFFVFAFYRIVPSWQIVFFPFSLIPLLLLTVGLGFVPSLFNGVARDTANAVSLTTTLLLFLTPVLYPTPKHGAASAFVRYNLLAPLVNSPRELIITGKISQPVEYLVAVLISVLIFLFCWRLFHLVEPKMAERV